MTMDKNLEKMIFDLNSRNEEASPELIKECTDHMLLRLALKGGNRSDVFSNLKSSDLPRALEKGYTAYPFKQLDENDDSKDPKSC